MTQNLNVFLNNLETQRANRVREAETERHNRATEIENFRANVAREIHNRMILSETQRSNMARERQARADLAEKTRSAKRNEELTATRDAAQRMVNLLNASTASYSARATARNQARVTAETERYNRVVASQRNRELQQSREYQMGQLSNASMRNNIDLYLGQQNVAVNRERNDINMFLGQGNLAVAQYNASTQRKKMYADMYSSTVNALSRSSMLKNAAPSTQKTYTLFDAVERELTSNGY